MIDVRASYKKDYERGFSFGLTTKKSYVKLNQSAKYCSLPGLLSMSHCIMIVSDSFATFSRWKNIFSSNQ